MEIERFTGELPSIAVLVNAESEVGPLAAALAAGLVDRNIRAVSCPNGQVVGSDNDVRVFSVEHIKGLEFEAAFFVGVDKLAQSRPTSFDKHLYVHLYVGATRAAMYLGVTCAGLELPNLLGTLKGKFAADWRQIPARCGQRHASGCPLQDLFGEQCAHELVPLGHTGARLSGR